MCVYIEARDKERASSATIGSGDGASHYRRESSRVEGGGCGDPWGEVGRWRWR